MADKWFISFEVEASLSYLPCNIFGHKNFVKWNFYKKPKTSKEKRVSRQLSRKVHKEDKTPRSNNYKKYSFIGKSILWR